MPFGLYMTIREEASRRYQIAAVFKLFDIDDSGTIEVKELKELGNARRILGQKTVPRNFQNFSGRIDLLTRVSGTTQRMRDS